MPRDGRTIHMHVEDIQKNADALQAGLSAFTATTLPSAGETATGPARNLALRVAEKVEAEGRQEPQRRSQPGPGQPGHDPAPGGQRQGIIYAVSYDHQPPFSHCPRHRYNQRTVSRQRECRHGCPEQRHCDSVAEISAKRAGCRAAGFRLPHAGRKPGMTAQRVRPTCGLTAMLRPIKC